MKNDNAKNKKRFNMGAMANTYMVIVAALMVFALAMLCFAYAIAFEFLSQRFRIEMPIIMVFLLVCLGMVIGFWGGQHCVVSNDSFKYNVLFRRLYVNAFNTAYAKYIKPKEYTVRFRETLKFDDIYGMKSYELIAYRARIKYIVFIMKDGKTKYARVDYFTNQRIGEIIDEVVKRSNGTIKDMRGSDDVIDLTVNSNNLMR